jgi:iron complex outermembrane receptor protein
LPAIEVVGRRQSGAYHAEEASGTRTDLPLREVPQAVRVMSRQTLDDLGANRIDDTLDFVGGVSRQNSFGGLWDNLALRGLPGKQSVERLRIYHSFASMSYLALVIDQEGPDRRATLTFARPL